MTIKEGSYINMEYFYRLQQPTKKYNKESNRPCMKYRPIEVKYNDGSIKERYQYLSECGTWQYSTIKNIKNKLIKRVV